MPRAPPTRPAVTATSISSPHSRRRRAWCHSTRAATTTPRATKNSWLPTDTPPPHSTTTGCTCVTLEAQRSATVQVRTARPRSPCVTGGPRAKVPSFGGRLPDRCGRLDFRPVPPGSSDEGACVPAADGTDARARRVAARLLSSRSRRGAAGHRPGHPGMEAAQPRHAAGGHPAGAARIAKALKALEPEGWVGLAQARLPGSTDGTTDGRRIDHLLIGPGGVVVLDSRSWVGRIE